MKEMVTWLREILDQLESELRDPRFDTDETGWWMPEWVERPNLLADIEAKRRLLDYLVDLEEKALNGDWWNLDTDRPFALLASAYADRPGYREEWRPRPT